MFQPITFSGSTTDEKTTMATPAWFSHFRTAISGTLGVMDSNNFGIAPGSWIQLAVDGINVSFTVDATYQFITIKGGIDQSGNAIFQWTAPIGWAQ